MVVATMTIDLLRREWADALGLSRRFAKRIGPDHSATFTVWRHRCEIIDRVRHYSITRVIFVNDSNAPTRI